MENTPEPRAITITASIMGYIDISSRVLTRIIDECPEILEQEAYPLYSSPDNWKQMWLKLIENIRERFL